MPVLMTFLTLMLFTCKLGRCLDVGLSDALSVNKIFDMEVVFYCAVL